MGRVTIIEVTRSSFYVIQQTLRDGGGKGGGLVFTGLRLSSHPCPGILKLKSHDN